MIPLVSIVCLAYNHEKYIRQCLDGFVMQETNFPFEIIVHEDASTDSTASIVKEYEANYPNLFHPIYQTENQYSKKDGSVTRFALGAVRGKYIAMCEGDDYWVDPHKLQKQVSFLEQHPDYTFSMGRVDMLIQKTGKIKRRKELVKPERQETYSLADYLRAPFSQTSSFIFRKGNQYPEWFAGTYAGDQAQVIVNTRDGKIKYHSDLLSIYRVHDGGVSKRKVSMDDTIKRVQIFFDSINELTSHKYASILETRMKRLVKVKKLIALRSRNKLLYYFRRAIMDITGI